LEVDAMVKISALLMMGAVMCLPAYVQAQSPIPETRVPGFGGTDARQGNPGGGPSSSGSGVGTNIGAGATASPSTDIVSPSGSRTPGGEVNPATGTSGSVTITR